MRKPAVNQPTSNPVPFQFESHEVRTVQKDDGTIWFVAKDIALALGISWSSATLKPIPDTWKGVIKLITPKGPQKIIIINEPAVYKLSFRSNKAEADRFTNWVVSEVLPSIRKTGAYTMVTLTPAQQREVQRLVSEKVKAASNGEKPKRNEFMKVYRSIKDEFQVAKYSQVPQDKFNEVVEFLGGKLGPGTARPYDIPEDEAEDIVVYIMRRIDSIVKDSLNLAKREALFRTDMQTEFLRMTNALATVFPGQMKEIRQHTIRKEAAA